MLPHKIFATAAIAFTALTTAQPADMPFGLPDLPLSTLFLDSPSATNQGVIVQPTGRPKDMDDNPDTATNCNVIIDTYGTASSTLVNQAVAQFSNLDVSVRQAALTVEPNAPSCRTMWCLQSTKISLCNDGPGNIVIQTQTVWNVVKKITNLCTQGADGIYDSGGVPSDGQGGFKFNGQTFDNHRYPGQSPSWNVIIKAGDCTAPDPCEGQLGCLRPVVG